jgi:hypothetical protein
MISLVYVPVIVVFTIIAFTPSIESTPPSKVVVQSSSEQRAVTIQSGSQNDQSDYRAILSFIKNKYHKIKQEDAESISKYLVEYGEKNQVDPKFAAALIARESSFNKGAVSKTGAKGLGQIKDFNFEALHIKDPFNVKENVSGTTQYLRTMFNQWQSRIDTGPSKKPKDTDDASEVAFVQPNSQLEKVKLSLASYYKGFTQVNREGGTFDEKTQQYVSDILSYYDEIMNHVQ